MKYIITENQLHYLRRLSVIDKLIKESLEMFDRWHFSDVDVDYIINHLEVDVAELYFFKFDDDEYVDGEQYDELCDFLRAYLNNNWRDKIEKLIKYHRAK